MHPVQVIIMDNLKGPNIEDIFRTYDLKGSTFKRITPNPSPGQVLKDLNFLDNKDDRLIVTEK